MTLRQFFGVSSAVSGSKDDSEPEPEDSDSDFLEPPSPKQQCPSSSSFQHEQVQRRAKSHPISSRRKYNKKWEKEFPWLEYDEDHQGAFCKFCRKRGRSHDKTGGAWITKPFNNWKKAIEKMRAHSKSDGHIQSCEAEITATRGRSVMQQLQEVGERDRLNNRAAIKALLRCTHFLARHHIAHTTNFSELVDLVVSCGGEDLRLFIERAGRNATYTSKDAVIDFIEAIGQWVEESLLKRLHQARYFSLMADECTDISTVEELSVFCRWVEDGQPVEHFIEIISLQKADAETIYGTLVQCLKKKSIEVSKLVGMGFDGAATFSGKHNGVQSLLKKISPHSIFVHCHCHLLQLACVQAANHTSGIKHVYTTLTTLWKFFHYSPKRAECLKEVQRVLNMPELKIIKPSDTRWLAHERCVKAVKENYSAIVLALNNIYEETHEPEALGISKALSKRSTVSALFLLDYALPQVAKLSKTLQAEKLDLTIISSLVDATLHTLDDALLPAANWVLELLDIKESLEEVADIKITMPDIESFQKTVGNPFISTLKDNISSRFTSQDVVSAFSIFDPKKVPSLESPKFKDYGEDSLKVLIDHYGVDRLADTLDGEECSKPALISVDVCSEWKTFRQYLTKQAKEDAKSQIQELMTNEMLITMFPHLNILADVCLSIPVGTASVERSFSQMKMIKTRLRNRIGETSLSHLMKIAIESPQKLSDDDLENIVSVWNRKNRRLVV